MPGFYRTAGGAEIDLLLELPGGERWAIEVKRSRIARPARGFHEACEDLKPARRLLVHGGADSFPLGNGVHALGVLELARQLSRLTDQAQTTPKTSVIQAQLAKHTRP